MTYRVEIKLVNSMDAIDTCFSLLIIKGVLINLLKCRFSSCKDLQLYVINNDCYHVKKKCVCSTTAWLEIFGKMGLSE